MILRLVLLTTFLLISGCASEQELGCTVPAGESPDWIRLIRCQQDYELLVSERDDAIFAHTSTLNWIIDREDENRVYFINTDRWDLHFYFADAYLNHSDLTPVGNHSEFNILNYRRANRRFLLGKVIHYRDQQLVTLEFSAGDTAAADLIIEGYTTIAEHLFDGEDLLYRPVSNDQEAMIDEIAQEIPVIRTEAVFAAQSYQPLNSVIGYGTLQFRRVAELAGRPVGPTDIVVLDRVPNDISLVSGIITGEFQTPLSHVNLLSKNRGTPNMGLRDAFDDTHLRALEGSLVRLSVDAQEYSIQEASLSDAQEFWDSMRPSSALVPQFDLSVDHVVNILDTGIADSIRVGAKAANMGEMSNMSAGSAILPHAPMALPFAWYRRHLQENQIEEEIERLLIAYRSDVLEPSELRAQLFVLRWRIFQAPMNASDLDSAVKAVASRYPAAQRLRFRSSTNVEDLAEFSGAGLYTSAGASLSEGQDAIADAVRVVWASAWNEKAFVEREFYRVDQLRVQMAVLVHPAFVDERANGVAVTINAFAQNRPAFYINSQIGEVSVTNPTGQAIAEQILYYTWYEEPEYEVITRSSLVAGQANWPGGQAVLTDSQLAELTDLLEQIHEHFRPLYPPRPDFAMDVEFKLTHAGKIMIKQARPLAVR